MLLIFLVAGAVAALVLLLIFLRRRKPRVEKPALPPHVRALKELRDLTAAGLAERGMVKPYYAAISMILRSYFSARYLIPAKEATTAEVTAQLKQRSLNSKVLADIRSILECSDLVKFARYVPRAQSVERAALEAIDIVEATRAEPGPDGGAPASGPRPQESRSSSAEAG